MNQLRIACVVLAFAVHIEVLLLNEPASGLDAIARRKVLSEMAQMLTDLSSE